MISLQKYSSELPFPYPIISDWAKMIDFICSEVCCLFDKIKQEFIPMLKTKTHLETSWAPVHKLNSALGLDGGNGSVDILGYNITTVQHAAGHVLAMARITLDHLVSRLKTGIGDFGH